MKSQGKVTIHDVAKQAGVSITTVSRVINNNYPVKQSTRKKVNDAIKALDFSPNLLAKGLINHRTNTIGVLVPSIANLFFSSVVKGLERFLKGQGYTILLVSTEGNIEEEKKNTKMLMDRQVDGIVVIDPQKENMEEGFFETITKQIPLVVVNGYNRGIRCNFVINDQEIGTIEAFQYLRDLNHERIAFLRGGKSYSYDLKEQIYHRLMEKSGLEKEKLILAIEDGNSIETTEMAMQTVLEIMGQENPPTAIFACNDNMAVGAINAAKKIGIQVPNQLSVIGFDNTLVSQLTDPKLTTVDQNMLHLGEVAGKRLKDIIENKDTTFTKTVIETNLVVRESSGHMG